ncbi:unnamed protein product [Prorocentrum cordatum]|uniref:Aquaporin n=1 Tax=Prorocentrum cordatum TaxID=2364126 RepID=A0ABN9SD57_9DINO|nr:unnamed protein product [Polarella glacialis]
MASRAALLAEFVGTFVLVFTVGCNILTGQSTWAGVSIACALMVAVYALAPISGANFNPAVSVALSVSKKLDWASVGLYVVTQVTAGVCAAMGYRCLFGTGFALEPTTGFSWWQAGLCELLYTFMLCFVVLNTACSVANSGKRQFYGLSIGFVIVAAAYGPAASLAAASTPRSRSASRRAT